MIVVTTNELEGKRVVKYIGIVTGEAIIGANIVKDFFAGIRDIVGGRSGSYEEGLREAKDIALREMQEQAARLGAMPFWVLTLIMKHLAATEVC